MLTICCGTKHVLRYAALSIHVSLLCPPIICTVSTHTLQYSDQQGPPFNIVLWLATFTKFCGVILIVVLESCCGLLLDMFGQLSRGTASKATTLKLQTGTTMEHKQDRDSRRLEISPPTSLAQVFVLLMDSKICYLCLLMLPIGYHRSKALYVVSV